MHVVTHPTPTLPKCVFTGEAQRGLSSGFTTYLDLSSASVVLQRAQAKLIHCIFYLTILFIQYLHNTVFIQYNMDIEQDSEVAQLCPTLCNPMDCSLPGSSLHGILQARVLDSTLEWVAIAFSRRSSRPRDQTWVSGIPGRCFNL